MYTVLTHAHMHARTHTHTHTHAHTHTHCRFIVRDFTYDPKVIAQERHEKSKLEMQLKKQFVSEVCLVSHLEEGRGQG